MKKGIYRAVDVKEVVVEKVNAVLAGRVVHVAVDVAKQTQYAAIRSEGEEVIIIVKWEQPSEMGEFLELLGSLDAKAVEVIVESTGTYADPLRYQAKKAGHAVFRASTKRVSDAAEVYDGVPSCHDPKAAWVIGRLHQQGLTEEWEEQDIQNRQLRAAIKTKAMFDDAEQRAICRLEAELARYWPELTSLLKLTSASLAKLLEAYGGPEAVAADPKNAAEVLRKVSRGNLTIEKVDAVIESARTTIGCPMIEDERFTLRVLAGDLLYQRYNAIKAEKRIHALIVDDQELEHAGKTFGKITAAVFFTLVGDPKNFDSVGALLKAFGLNMKIWSSGKKKGELHITKRGSGVARWYMYLAALRMLKTEPIVKAWYDRKVARDGGKVKLKGVVAIMRKLIGALWHVAQGKTFDASLLFDTSRLHLADRRKHGAGAVSDAA